MQSSEAKLLALSCGEQSWLGSPCSTRCSKVVGVNSSLSCWNYHRQGLFSVDTVFTPLGRQQLFIKMSCYRGTTNNKTVCSIKEGKKDWSCCQRIISWCGGWSSGTIIFYLSYFSIIAVWHITHNSPFSTKEESRKSLAFCPHQSSWAKIVSWGKESPTCIKFYVHIRT